MRSKFISLFESIPRKEKFPVHKKEKKPAFDSVAAADPKNRETLFKRLKILGIILLVVLTLFVVAGIALAAMVNWKDPKSKPSRWFLGVAVLMFFSALVMAPQVVFAFHYWRLFNLDVQNEVTVEQLLLPRVSLPSVLLLVASLGPTLALGLSGVAEENEIGIHLAIIFCPWVYQLPIYMLIPWVFAPVGFRYGGNPLPKPEPQPTVSEPYLCTCQCQQKEVNGATENE